MTEKLLISELKVRGKLRARQLGQLEDLQGAEFSRSEEATRYIRNCPFKMLEEY